MEEQHSDDWLSIIYEALSGDISPEMKQQLDDWLLESPSHQSYYEEMVRLWNVLPFADSEDHRYNASVAFMGFRQRIMAERVQDPPPVRHHLRFWRYAVAACLLVCGTLAAAYWLWGNAPSAIPVAQVIAEKGTKSRTVLGDGTTVWLNADSRLEIHEGFGQRARRVRLTGEAFFDVTTNPTLPFVVETGSLNVEVLGTSFNVSCYPDGSSVSVALIEGQVALRPEAGDLYRLKPNQTAYFDASSQRIVIEDEIRAETVAWRSDQYIFVNKQFSDIILDLERIYGVTIQVQVTDLLDRKFTGDFVRGEDIREVMDVLSSLGTFSYYITGKQIQIKEK